MLKRRKLLILRSCKTAKSGPSAEVRYTAGTRIPKTPGLGATAVLETQPIRSKRSLRFRSGRED